MEAVRIILKVSEYLPWNETITHLNKFSKCMKWSGYSKEEGFQTICCAIKRVIEMKAKIVTGDRNSQFRDKQQIVTVKESWMDWSNT